jgi:YesN/AraC family two-component response regulator
MPGETIIWSCDESSCCYLETLNPLDFEWRKSHRRLTADEFVLSRKIKLINMSKCIATVRGFIIKIEKNVNILNRPIILKVASYKDDFTQLISKLFSTNSFDEDIVFALENTFPDFYSKACNHNRNNNTYKTQSPSGKIDSRLLIINRYIRKYYFKPLTLRELSELIQCNPIYLSNSYSKVFKISPIKYHQNLKMLKAKEMIMNTHLNINEIAGRLGYVSNSQFSELFKRYHGASPTEFRKSLM